MQHWDYYWQKTKTLNSFAEGEQGQGYHGEVAEFWQRIFAEFTKGAKVLDLASGNGALAVLALQSNNHLDISASDKADICPMQLFDKQSQQYKYLQRIKFYGGMPSEELRFPDESFDIVVSQFGFEYSEPEATLQQLYRVLKPGAKFVALVHHKDSFISRDCVIGLSVLPLFTKHDGLLDKAREFAKFCQQLQQVKVLSLPQQQLLKQHSDLLLANFIAVQKSVTAEQLEWFNLVAKELVSGLADWRSNSTEIIDKLTANLNFFKCRIEDQVGACWSVQQRNVVQIIAQQVGFSASSSILETKHGKFSWVFQLSK